MVFRRPLDVYLARAALVFGAAVFLWLCGPLSPFDTSTIRFAFAVGFAVTLWLTWKAGLRPRVTLNSSGIVVVNRFRSANDYDYTNADPINNTDLNGQWSCRWCKKAATHIGKNWRDYTTFGVAAACIFLTAGGCLVASVGLLVTHTAVDLAQRKFSAKSFAINAAFTLAGGGLGRAFAGGWKAKNVVREGGRHWWAAGVGRHQRGAKPARQRVNWGSTVTNWSRNGLIGSWQWSGSSGLSSL